MHRLFVAIRPPAEIRRILLDSMGGVPGARFQSDEQLHLTLAFIGAVDRHRAEDAAAALGAVHHPRFELSLRGGGSFDRRGRIDTVWAGIASSDPLKTLQAKVARALDSAGVPPERRAFVPHITVARLGAGTGPLEPLLARLAALSSPAFTVEDFRLYESHLGHEGSVYEVAEQYPLA
ncbi:RNA 2',3'-cyclic phosphodiesterase [Sphingomonas sp. ID0503]|uniref:RNA 2',3'-cyclic phosphodiesterase n=1 Tax=Sphingomonas sp. ID0503 TaxID=3399691 RepID=UPI003AFADC6A